MNNRLKLIIGVVILIATGYLFSALYYKNTGDSNHEAHVHGEQTARTEKNGKAIIYTCPMHPEIRESKPGSCPICNMKLVKVASEESTNREVKDEISFNISPYQARLVGIKPIKAKRKAVQYAIPVSGRLISKSTLAIQVFEKDLRYIKPGVKFSGHSEIYPEDTIQGVVSSVDNIADPSSRTVRVIVRIDDGGRNTLAESSFTGQVLINLGEQLVVPEKSIFFSGDTNIVYLYKNDQLYPKKISIGAKVGEEYVVLDGLTSEDLISSGPNFLIDSESKIRGLSTSDTSEACPKGQQWNSPMSMCMPGTDL